MKNNTYLLVSFLLLGMTFSVAQQNLITVPLPNSKSENIEFSKSWNFIFDTNKKQLIINGGEVSNKSASSNTGYLKIDYYLITQESKLENPKKGYFITELEFNPINKRSSNTGISITGNLSNDLPNGKYYPLLVLYEKRFGQYTPIDYAFKTNKVLHIQNNELTFNEELIEEEEIEENIVESNILIENPSEKMLLSFTDNLSLNGTWKINIDFENFLVEINGDVMLKNHYESKGPLSIKLYMNREKYVKGSTKFEGYLISQAELKSAKTHTSTSAKIKMNLNRIIPQGLYFPLLVLSEEGENGETIIKAVRIFDNMVKF